jgi:histone acetyltransferase
LGTPREVDEPPRKRSRLNGHEGEDGEEEDHAEPKTSPRHGKKPGKTGGTGKMFTKPRTVVRGARGLVPMETEPDGSQHVGGHLPDSAMLGNEGEEDDDDDVPLAKQRPQLEEGERLRREMIKEKEKEREEDLLRRVAEEDVEGMENLEIWEGVELVSALTLYTFSPVSLMAPA